MTSEVLKWLQWCRLYQKQVSLLDCPVPGQDLGPVKLPHLRLSKPVYVKQHKIWGAFQLFSKARPAGRMGVWPQTTLMTKAYQKQEHMWEIKPPPSGETDPLPGDLIYLAEWHLVRVTNYTGGLGMKATCDSSLKGKYSVTLLTPSALLKLRRR